MALLTIGEFHKGEVTARSAERWLGLTPRGAGFVWRMYTIVVRPVEDPLLDQPGEKTGTQVRVSGGEPVFLIRGAAQFRSTAVRSAFFKPGGQSFYETGSIAIDCRGCGGRSTLRLVDRLKGDSDAPRPS